MLLAVGEGGQEGPAESCANVMIQCQQDLSGWVQSAAGEGQTSHAEFMWGVLLGKGKEVGEGREMGRREREQSKEWLMGGEREGERRRQRLTERGRSRSRWFFTF